MARRFSGVRIRDVLGAPANPDAVYQDAPAGDDGGHNRPSHHDRAAISGAAGAIDAASADDRIRI
jgi:hypothetical protein